MDGNFQPMLCTLEQILANPRSLPMQKFSDAALKANLALLRFLITDGRIVGTLEKGLSDTISATANKSNVRLVEIIGVLKLALEVSSVLSICRTTREYDEAQSSLLALAKAMVNDDDFSKQSNNPRLFDQLSGIIKDPKHGAGTQNGSTSSNDKNNDPSGSGSTLADNLSYLKIDETKQGEEPNSLFMKIFGFIKSDDDQLDRPKKINILIMGETGVGKSTWINGILNYISFRTLKEAEDQDIRCAIPTSFNVSDENYEQVRVTVGEEDKNENQMVGKSSTQFPKTYVYRSGNTLVRLIDTPGIGDTSGIVQDRENFKRIMDHLSFVDEIHGICILLKPNNSRLTVVFQFCIKELLTHLHRDASKNIVFCFTNCRQTFYRPGDTLAGLKKLLQENKNVNIEISKDTLYCMDNEAFRFLAALKQGVGFSDEDRVNYSASWNRSVEETDRLITYISGLNPHKTKKTVSLNDSRVLITELTKPLAEISKNIQDNLKLLNDKEVEIAQLGTTCEDLSSRLKIPAVNLKHRTLGYPRTVCGAEKCIELLPGPNGVLEPYYRFFCHEHCYLTVSTGCRQQAELQYCDAMGPTAGASSAQCTTCKCSWSVHMHQTYETYKVNTEMDNVNVVTQLADRSNQIEEVQAFIDKLRKKGADLKNEQKIITEISAEFATFLQANAITSYNDVLEDYLDYLIQVERSKVGLGGDKTILEGLETMKSNYKEEIRILNEALASGTKNVKDITPQRIEELVKKLFALPISGQSLQDMITVTGSASRKFAQYSEAQLIKKDWIIKKKPVSLIKRFGNWLWGN